MENKRIEEYTKEELIDLVYSLKNEFIEIKKFNLKVLNIVTNLKATNDMLTKTINENNSIYDIIIDNLEDDLIKVDNSSLTNIHNSSESINDENDKKKEILERED